MALAMLAAGVLTPATAGATAADPTPHGFLLSGGTVTTIDAPGTTNAVLLGGKDRNQIVGSYALAARGATATTASLPGPASWIDHYAGPFDSGSGCEAERQAHIEQEVNAGQMFIAWDCAFAERNPETGTGSPGWYYLWGIYTG